MGEGDVIPQRNKQPQKWTRRSLHRHLGIAIETLYKWENEIHTALPTLPHSFMIWKVLNLPTAGKKRKHPPLDDYQVECLMLLAKLRETAYPGDTIAQTVEANEFSFYQLHKKFSPHHKTQEEKSNESQRIAV